MPVIRHFVAGWKAKIGQMVEQIKNSKIGSKIFNTKFRGILMVIFAIICVYYAFRDLKNGINGVKGKKEG